VGYTTVTEPSFLITELRYTLGQLHVQIGDLDAETRRTATCEGRNVDQILAEMLTEERRFQATYQNLLHVSPPKPHREEALIGKNELEVERMRTIALLEQAPSHWPDQLVELVREHVASDRRSTTQLAECRKSLYSHDQRPDLDEPLLSESDIEPHALT
jgi:hypothetical protein